MFVQQSYEFSRGAWTGSLSSAGKSFAKASIARDGGTTVESDDISKALDDMLFAGGKLNVKLLGGAREMVEA